MADSIVACPSCGRKYKVAEGSPAGEFQCTSCQTAVTYGETPVQAAPARAVPAKARPAGPGARGGGPRRGAQRGGGRGGRRPARGRGPARGGRRGRGAAGYEDDEYGYAPPPSSNMGLYITLAVIGFVVVVGGVVLLLTSGEDEPQRRAEQPDVNPVPYVAPNNGTAPTPGDPTGGTPSGNTEGSGARNSGGNSGTEREPDTIAPLPTGGSDRPVRAPDRPNPGERPRAGQPAPGNTPRGISLGPVKAPPGDLYGVEPRVLRSMARKDAMSIVKDLKHYDDTPASVQADIDKYCAIICDLSAGGRMHKARDLLVKIGQPAMPRILSCFTRTGDWGTNNGMMLACYVDGTLREITGGGVNSYQIELKPMSNPSKDQISKNVVMWFVWWYSQGYSLDTYETESDDEDEEDD